MPCFFGMRSRQEHVNLRWGDIKVKRTSIGEQFLEYPERSTKTHTVVTSENRAFTPKMFEEGNPSCPVYIYQLYAEKDQINETIRFTICIGINKRSNEQSELWFVNQAMGHKSLSSNYSTASLDQQKQMSCILSNLNKQSTLKSASSTVTTSSVNQFPVDSLVLNNVNKSSKKYINSQKHINNLFIFKPVSLDNYQFYIISGYVDLCSNKSIQQQAKSKYLLGVSVVQSQPHHIQNGLHNILVSV
ncbi:hypothetical protein KUTeg_011237 [Tegillarca granosa]|uniref:Uncharacterized protein n=1 Tax=Tegillarca granosa TaxID=220873 RepID=A0ABQ9F1E0_TEGGR|nr:hypothetical protein KUTeg_011237 [Tegillarca granosa]